VTFQRSDVTFANLGHERSISTLSRGSRVPRETAITITLAINVTDATSTRNAIEQQNNNHGSPSSPRAHAQRSRLPLRNGAGDGDSTPAPRSPRALGSEYMIASTPTSKPLVRRASNGVVKPLPLRALQLTQHLSPPGPNTTPQPALPSSSPTLARPPPQAPAPRKHPTARLAQPNLTGNNPRLRNRRDDRRRLLSFAHPPSSNDSRRTTRRRNSIPRTRNSRALNALSERHAHCARASDCVAVPLARAGAFAAHARKR
jgi:hypothetical protein